MPSNPFFLKRPALLYRGLAVDRDRPDLVGLSAIDDPERFVWSILPHAARSFAASIVMLPAGQALTSAVAYLYARMLDTYEDLLRDPAAQRSALTSFAARFSCEPMGPAPPIGDAEVEDERDQVHILLVERFDLVDRVFSTLSARDRANIAELIAAMAAGMIWAADIFETQHGVLETEEQRIRYCHHVIGQPVLFVLGLMTPGDLKTAARRDALAVSEMIQMANITRDIERDLDRGVAYHPLLRPYLSQPPSHSQSAVVRSVRRLLLVEALTKVPAYGRLLEANRLRGISRARGSAVLMLLFTDRYYRESVQSVGGTGWGKRRSSTAIYASSLLATLSSRWASHEVAGVEQNFLVAAGELMTDAD